MALAHNPTIQVLDANGNPYSGAKLYIYDAGTTTDRTTYSDSALSSANAQPLVADSAGVFGPIFFNDSETTDYKFSFFTSADVSIPDFDRDNIPLDGTAPPYYAQTTDETSEGVTVVNFEYPPGQIERYGTNTTPGTTDMTTAVQAAFTMATDYGVQCVAAGGTYATTTTLDIDAFTPGVASTFFAESRVRIICSDLTVPVADVGGRTMRWIGLWSFEHSSLPSSSNTSALGWRINNYLAYSVFDDLQFRNNYGAWQPAQSGGFLGTNTAFANTINNLYITQFSGFAIDWDAAPTGGHTPTFIGGCYINNFADDGTTKTSTSVYPVQVKSGDSLVFGHLHVEHMEAPGIVQTGSDAGALIANAIHIEGFEANSESQLFDCLSNSGLVVNQIYMNGSSLEVATIGGNTYGLFRVAAGSQVICQRFYETDNTVDITSWKVARAATPDIESAVWVNGGRVTTATGGDYTTILLTADTSQELNSSLPSILRRWLGKDNFRVIDSPNNIYEWWASSAPAGGAWTRGSIVHMETPSEGSNLGWICVTAGTPGTWVRFGIAGFQEDTATNIISASATVNTTNKWKGKRIWDTTNMRELRASGSNATDDWEVVDGSTQVTPV